MANPTFLGDPAVARRDRPRMYTTPYAVKYCGVMALVGGAPMGGRVL